MRQGYVLSIRRCIKQRVTNITVANLLAFDIWNIKGFFAVRANQAEIDGWGGLQLHLKKLMANVWELPVVLVVGISQTLTDQTMQCRAPVTFLVIAGICEALSDESL